MSVEVAKARVQQCGETWKTLYALDSRWEELEQVFLSVFVPDVDPSEQAVKFQSDFIPKMQSELADVEAARRDLREAHFWVGNAAVDFEQYLDLFASLVRRLAEGDYEKYQAAQQEHAALRRDATNLLDRIVEAWK